MILPEFMVNLGASENLLLVSCYTGCDNYTRVEGEEGLMLRCIQSPEYSEKLLS